MSGTWDRQTGIRNAIREYILAEFLPGEDPTSLRDQTPLISSGVLDSIATAKLVSHLEEIFDIRFAAHEVNAVTLDTVERIVNTVVRKLPQ
jgi:acyl carrier protein